MGTGGLHLGMVPTDLSHHVVLIQRGKPTAFFDKSLDELLDGLEHSKLILATDRAEVRARCTRSDPIGTAFDFGFPWVQDPRVDYGLLNKTKKRIQEEIGISGKSNDITIFGRFEYPIQCDESTRIPIDVLSILFGLGQRIKGLDIKHYDEGSRDFFIKEMLEHFGLPWEICVQIRYELQSIDEKFYDRIRTLSDYLLEHKWLAEPIQTEDVRRRYSDAIKQVAEQLVDRPDLAELVSKHAKSTVDGRMDLSRFVEEVVPKSYYFTLYMVGIPWNVFVEVQGEALRNLVALGNKYALTLLCSTNATGNPVGYGCYVLAHPELLKEPISAHPDVEADRTAKIHLLMRAGDDLGALRVLEEHFDRENAADWYNRGNILGRLKRLEEAERAYDSAIALRPRYIKAWYRKGEINLYDREWLAAYRCFMTAAGLEDRKTDHGKNPVNDPWRPAALLNATICLISERDLKKAQLLLAQLQYCYRMLQANKLISEVNMNPTAIENGEFTDFLLSNREMLLDKVEPPIVAQVYTNDDFELAKEEVNDWARYCDQLIEDQLMELSNYRRDK